MTREDEVDNKMLEAFYLAYKNGTKYPGSTRDSKLQEISITAEEFIASQRRLMQKELLEGKETRTRAGTLYSPTGISKKGKKLFEKDDVDPLFQDMVFIDTGFSGKKYRLSKWFHKHFKFIIATTIGILGLILTSAGVYLSMSN